MSGLYFQPYQPKDFDGTLVFADSHYRGRNGGESGWGPGFEKLLGGDERNWTLAQLKDVLSRKEGDQDRLYVRLRNVLYPHLTVAKCFERAAFAVAVQEVLPSARAARDYGLAEEVFRATLKVVKPRRVLVAGMMVWRELHGEDETFDNQGLGFELCRYGDVWATCCYHPTGSRGRFKAEEARKAFELLLRATGKRP